MLPEIATYLHPGPGQGLIDTFENLCDPTYSACRLSGFHRICESAKFDGDVSVRNARRIDKRLAAATTARGVVGFAWFSEAGHSVIRDGSPVPSTSANFFRTSLPISTNRPRNPDVAAMPNLVRA
jgi:hypothetical protein